MSRFPVHLPEGALSWESQIVQYRDAEPPSEAGTITYYAGSVDSLPPVDCLLYWAPTPDGVRLRIVGILNHYAVDYPPWEKAGNVNVWVRRSHQRRGIATALWDEAQRRWPVSLDQQRFTVPGAALADALVNRKGAP